MCRNLILHCISFGWLTDTNNTLRRLYLNYVCYIKHTFNSSVEVFGYTLYLIGKISGVITDEKLD